VGKTADEHGVEEGCVEGSKCERAGEGREGVEAEVVEGCAENVLLL